MNKTLYKKEGRRYVPVNYYDVTGYPPGLYLLYKPDYKGEHTAMMNMIHYAKVYDIKNVGKFCDLVSSSEVLSQKLHEGVKEWVETHGSYSWQDIVNILLKLIADGEV